MLKIVLLILDIISLLHGYILLSNSMKILILAYFQIIIINPIYNFLLIYLLSLMFMFISYNFTSNFMFVIYLSIIYILSTFNLLSNIFFILSLKIT